MYFDYLILGLGTSGLACVRYLRQYQPQANLLVADTRSYPPAITNLTQEFPEIPVISGTNFDQALLQKANQIIVSPGINLYQEPFISYSNKDSLLGEITLFAQAVTQPILGITGSNGKSTVTTLLGQVMNQAGLKTRVGGNLSPPALSLIDATAAFYLLELSSFQLDLTSHLPLQVATILNLAPNHLERHSSIADYLRAKQKILDNCQTAVINLDQPATYQNLTLPTNQATFGTYNTKADYTYKNNWIYRHQKPILAAEELKIHGQHNLINVCAVLAISETLNIPLTNALTTITNFEGLPYRCQWIANLRGVDWYNDSKGTNPAATISAIQSLASPHQKNLILILGGVDKEADFTCLNRYLESSVVALILFGRDQEKILRQLKFTGQVKQATNFNEVIQFAYKLAAPPHKVVFSPACASFDMFQNFEERGAAFTQQVLALI